MTMKNLLKYCTVLMAAALLLCLTLRSNAQYAPQKDLIVYYPLDDDFNDKSGKARSQRYKSSIVEYSAPDALAFEMSRYAALIISFPFKAYPFA